jgi:hypothetical protein
MLRTYDTESWQEEFHETTQAQATGELEAGQLLHFPQLKFELNDPEQRLLSPALLKPDVKNISFNLMRDEIKGVRAAPEEVERLRSMMERFARQARTFVSLLLPQYSPYLIQGRTSYRPVGVETRLLSPRKDDRRLHVDAFPATPNQGRRLLRVFSNINPHGEDRVWRLGEPFEEVADRFVPRVRKPLPGSAHLLKALGLTKSHRSQYDHYMLSIHDRMKMDDTYQRQATQTTVRFPSGSSWIVQTDHVSHAAMSGQYLLEQTFYLPTHAMLNEQLSPLRILERHVGMPLVG